MRVVVSSETITCRTCGNSGDSGQVEAWHPFRHPLNVFGVAGPLNAKPEPEGITPEAMPWPLDPVLRQALIDKGILTPDDLRAAEEKIRSITGHVMRGTGE